MKMTIVYGLFFLCGNVFAEDQKEAYFEIRVSEVATIQQIITQQTATIEQLSALVDTLKQQRDALSACVLATSLNHKNALTCIGASEL